MNTEKDVTQVLNRVSEGDRGAAEELLPLVYEDFRSLAKMYMSRESYSHTLQPTALVHEAFLKLIDQTRVDWQGRTHFFAVGAQAMRRILVDHARRKRREKHGGTLDRIELDDDVALSPQSDQDVLALEEALEKLETVDERQSKIVELRFYAGLTVKEVAEVLGVSKRTIEAEWTMVRAWLRKELSADNTS